MACWPWAHRVTSTRRRNLGSLNPNPDPDLNPNPDPNPNPNPNPDPDQVLVASLLAIVTAGGR